MIDWRRCISSAAVARLASADHCRCKSSVVQQVHWPGSTTRARVDRTRVHFVPGDDLGSSFLRSYSSVSVSASAVDISVVGKKRSLVDVDAQETDRVDGQGQATCMVQLKPAKVLTISDLTLSPVTAQTPCFAQDCLDLVMDYLIKTVLQPRNAAVREGSSKRNADATMTWIPCKEYSATPLLEKMQLGCLLPAHTCPCPDDYVFSQSKVWCIDLVDTYNIALECPECKEAGRYPSKLAANCWSHQAASDSGVSGS
eukprot:1894571-Rhodomonas_salina.4